MYILYTELKQLKEICTIKISEILVQWKLIETTKSSKAQSKFSIKKNEQENQRPDKKPIKSTNTPPTVRIAQFVPFQFPSSDILNYQFTKFTLCVYVFLPQFDRYLRIIQSFQCFVPFYLHFFTYIL